MKKTASVRRRQSYPARTPWPENYFSGQSAGRDSTTSGTGLVLVSSQGLSSSWSKLSPENIASSQLVAPGFPRNRSPLREGELIQNSTWWNLKHSQSSLQLFLLLPDKIIIYRVIADQDVFCWSMHALTASNLHLFNGIVGNKLSWVTIYQAQRFQFIN